jgi:hypothetical protein
VAECPFCSGDHEPVRGARAAPCDRSCPVRALDPPPRRQPRPAASGDWSPWRGRVGDQAGQQARRAAWWQAFTAAHAGLATIGRVGVVAAVAGADVTQEECDLIARARQLRQDAGVPIGEMADRCGVTKSTMSVWERDPPAGLGRLPRDRDKARRWVAVLAVLAATSDAVSDHAQ